MKGLGTGAGDKRICTVGNKQPDNHAHTTVIGRLKHRLPLFINGSSADEHNFGRPSAPACFGVFSSGTSQFLIRGSIMPTCPKCQREISCMHLDLFGGGCPECVNLDPGITQRRNQFKRWARCVAMIPFGFFAPFVLIASFSAPDMVTSIAMFVVAASTTGLIIVTLFFDVERRPTAESRWAHFFSRHSLAPGDIACVFEDFFGAASVTIEASTGRITFERCHFRWWQIALSDPTVTFPVREIIEIMPPFRSKTRHGWFWTDLVIVTPSGTAYVPSRADGLAGVIKHLRERVPTRAGRDLGLLNHVLMLACFAAGMTAGPVLASVIWPQLSPAAFAWWFLGGMIASFVLMFNISAMIDRRRPIMSAELTLDVLEKRYREISSPREVPEDAGRLRDLMIALSQPTGRPYFLQKAYREEERSRHRPGVWEIEAHSDSLAVWVSYRWQDFSPGSSKVWEDGGDRELSLVLIRALLDFAHVLGEAPTAPWKVIAQRFDEGLIPLWDSGPSPRDFALCKRFGFDSLGRLEIVLTRASHRPKRM
jgi:hypothetical protein